MDPSYNNPPSNPVAPNGVNTGGVFGGGNNGQMNHDSGDIILQADGKKPKNGVIIGVIVVFVIIVAGLTAGFIMMNSDSKDVKGDVAVAKTTEEKLNKYENYMVDGEISTEPIEIEYDRNIDYAIVKAFAEKDYDYFNELTTLWNDFENAFNDIEKEGHDTLNKKVRLQSNLMGFLNKRLSFTDLTSDAILESVLDHGADKTNLMIEETYAPFKEDDYFLSSYYADAKIAKGKKMVELFVVYNENGCIVERRQDIDCIDKLSTADGLKQEYREVSDNEDINNDDLIVPLLLQNIQGVYDNLVKMEATQDD